MKKNKIFIIFVLMLSLLTAIVSASFAWFQASLSSKGNTIETGNFLYEAKGWNESGTLVSQIYTDKDLAKLLTVPANANKPIFENKNATGTALSAGSHHSAYVSINYLTGSIPFDFSLSFSVGDNQNDALSYLGAFYYKVSVITSSVSSASGSNLAAKIASYATANASTYLGTEGTQPMTQLEDYRIVGSLSSSSSPLYVVYRIDYGMYSDATVEAYTGQGFTINSDITLAQSGTLDGDVTVGTIYNVSTMAQLTAALATLNNGDVINFTKTFTYSKDLIISNPVTLNFQNGVELSVTGNVSISYSAAQPTNINFYGTGKLLVKTASSAGGTFDFSAPNGSLNMQAYSHTSVGCIYVANKITTTASHSDGVNVIASTFYKLNASNAQTTVVAPLYLGSNTHLQVDTTTTIPSVIANANATNIKITNNGAITDCDLSSMYDNKQTDNPEIEYISYSQSACSLTLPTWSSTFVVGTPNTGNTRVKEAAGSTAVTFTATSVTPEVEFITVYVVDNNSSNAGTDMTIYYQDKYDSATGTTTAQSIETILRNYYSSLGYTTTADQNSHIHLIEKLTIVSKGDTLTTTDFTYLKTLCDVAEGTNADNLTHIDLTNATVVSNALPAKAFYQCLNLKNLDLPLSITTMYNQSVAETGIEEITVPENIITFGSGKVFDGIKFIHLAHSTIFSTGENFSSWAISDRDVSYTEVYPIILCNQTFLDAAYSGTYVSGNFNYTRNFVNHLYLEGVLDDSGKFILTKQSGNNYYISATIASQVLATNYDSAKGLVNYVVGQGLTVSGAPVTITGIGIGGCRFLNRVEYNGNATNNYEITLADSITTLSAFSFGQFLSASNSTPNTEVGSDYFVRINFNNVTTIPTYSMMCCFRLLSCDFTNVTTIKTLAFRSCFALSYLDLSNVQTIETKAFNYCSGLNAVYFKNIKSIGQQAFDTATTGAYADYAIKEIVFDCTPSQVTINANWLTASSNTYKTRQVLQECRIYITSSYFTAWNANQLYVSKLGGQFVNNPFYIHMWGTKIGTYEIDGYNYGSCIAYEDSSTIHISSINIPISTDLQVPSGLDGWTAVYGTSTKAISLEDYSLDVTSVASTATITFTVSQIGPQFTLGQTLTGITFNSSSTVTSLTINASAFAGVMFKVLTLPGCTYSIGDSAFSGCTILTTVTQVTGSSCSGIGASAFYGDSALITVNASIASGVVGASAFSQCTSLTTLNLDGTLNGNYTLGDSVAYGCSVLANLSVANATSIGASAFAYCQALVTANLKKCTTISFYAFSNCSVLQKVFFDSLATFVPNSSGNSYIFENDAALNYLYFGSTGNVTTTSTTNFGLRIPDTVSNLVIVSRASNAFLKNTDFSSTSLPSSLRLYLTNLNAYIDYHDNSLSSVRAFNTFIREIPAAYNFVNGTVIAPSSYTSSSVTYLYFTTSSNNVTIANVSGISSASSYTVPSTLGGNNVVKIGYNSYISGNTFAASSTITLPSTITTIGAGSFEAVTGFTTVSMTGTPTIEPYAFFGSSVTSLSSSDAISGYGTTTINGYTVAYADKSYVINGTTYSGKKILSVIGTASSLSIPSTIGGSYVYGIDESAFDNVTALTSLSLPSCLIGVTGKTFKTLSALTAYAINDAGSGYRFITVNNDVLYSLTDSSTMYTLLSYPQAKSGTSYTAQSCKIIGDYAFYHATLLTSLTLPSTVVAIGNYCCQACSSSLVVTILSTALPSVGTNAFMTSSSSTIAQIKVVSSIIAYYQRDPYFSKYNAIIVANS